MPYDDIWINIGLGNGLLPGGIKPLPESRVGNELSRFNKVNVMAAEALAPYVARTSAAMILIIYNMYILILFEEEF